MEGSPRHAKVAPRDLSFCQDSYAGSKTSMGAAVLTPSLVLFPRRLELAILQSLQKLAVVRIALTTVHSWESEKGRQSRSEFQGGTPNLRGQ